MYEKAKRNEFVFEVLRMALAIGIAMLLVIIIIFIVSGNPADALYMLFVGPFTNMRRVGNIIEAAIPITFTGLALSLTFRAKQFNMVADGAFYAGGMAACLVGLKLNLPPALAVVLALVSGALVGAALGAIPAIMKIKVGAMELVTSLMLNYLIGYVVLYILVNKVRSTKAMALESATLPKGVELIKIVSGTRIHLGLVIVAACVILSYIFIYKTKWGYALRMTGTNKEFAHYSGLSVNNVILWAQVAGAAMAGLGGATELLGMYTAFKWVSSPHYGFDGVIVATLAKRNPALVPVAALFLGYIRTGADILNRSGDVPYEIVSVIQATIILLIASTGFLKGLKQRSLEKQTILANKGGASA